MDVQSVRSKGIPVELDKVRHLKYDLNAFAELEERYGSVEEAMKVLQSGTIKGVRTLLWCGFVHEDEKLTERQVGALIGIQDLAMLTEKISQAMTAALPVAISVPATLNGEQAGN